MNEIEKNLSDQLLAADSKSDSTATDPVFERLLDAENRFELRVRRAALGAWVLAFVCIVTCASAFGAIRNGSDVIVESARVVLIVAVITGAISLAAAAFASLQWLFRSHTPTLRAIERRLAALEKSLIRQSQSMEAI